MVIKYISKRPIILTGPQEKYIQRTEKIIPDTLDWTPHIGLAYNHLVTDLLYETDSMIVVHTPVNNCTNNIGNQTTETIILHKQHIYICY